MCPPTEDATGSPPRLPRPEEDHGKRGEGPCFHEAMISQLSVVRASCKPSGQRSNFSLSGLESFSSGWTTVAALERSHHKPLTMRPRGFARRTRSAVSRGGLAWQERVLPRLRFPPFVSSVAQVHPASLHRLDRASSPFEHETNVSAPIGVSQGSSREDFWFAKCQRMDVFRGDESPVWLFCRFVG